jgi:hypothetical protein
MNHQLAQMASIVCHGNALLRGLQVPSFFPENSTCEDCDSVRFVEQQNTLFGKEREILVSAYADEWLGQLRDRGVVGLKLGPMPGSDLATCNFKSAVSIGGAGAWAIEILTRRGLSEFSQARWKVADPTAEQKIWLVSYSMFRRSRTVPSHVPTIEESAINLRDALVEIREFTEPYEQCQVFSVCFAKALRSLDNPNYEAGYYKDLAPFGLLGEEASCLLAAAMNAWVFGGTDSWNNLKFDRDARGRYEKLTSALFLAINEAVQAAIADTLPKAETSASGVLSA